MGYIQIYFVLAVCLCQCKGIDYDQALDRILRLAELRNIENTANSYVGDSNIGKGPWRGDDMDEAYNYLLGMASLRDEEYLPENRLWGYQYISEAKSNKSLDHEAADGFVVLIVNQKLEMSVPLSAKDGCLEHFQNSAEVNRQYQKEQDCSCDADHMFSCPINSKVINTKNRKSTSSSGSGHELGDGTALKPKHYEKTADNYVYKSALKRVAKKSPVI